MAGMTTARVAPVVVGVDGSPASAQAVRLAAYEAVLQHRPLRLLHAFNWMPDYPAGVTWSRLDAERLLDRATQSAQARAPEVEAVAEIVEGSAVEALLHVSRNAALVVVGEGHLAAYVSVSIDATAIHIAAQAECSVMVVRNAEEIPGPVLVGVDGSAGSEQALGFAFDAAAQRQTELVVLQVEERDDDPPGDPPAAPVAAPVAPAVVGLADWRQKYPGVAVRQQTHQGDPGRVLAAAAGTAELLVVGARGERPSDGLLGSVCLSVLQHAPCPVVVVRGRAHLAQP